MNAQGREPAAPVSSSVRRTLTRAEVLILDDFGLQVLDAPARHDLLEIIEERYGRRSTIIASQPPVEK